MFCNIKRLTACVVMCLLSSLFLVGFEEGGPKTFSVIDSDGNEVVYTSSKKTIGEALKALDIPHRKNRVYPEVSRSLSEDMRVYVLDRGEKIHVKDTFVNPPVEYFDDYNLDYGMQKIEQEGKHGRVDIVSKVVENDDGSTTVTEIGREYTMEPTRQIVRRGMLGAVKTPEGIKRYSKKMKVQATAYTIHCGNGDGVTSIGLIPKRGIVAVDPEVIPYYTKMYVPGYGVALAGDCGGAIQGHIIDVFVDSYDEAWDWGRKNIEIYILEE